MSIILLIAATLLIYPLFPFVCYFSYSLLVAFISFRMVMSAYFRQAFKGEGFVWPNEIDYKTGKVKQ